MPWRATEVAITPRKAAGVRANPEIRISPLSRTLTVTVSGFCSSTCRPCGAMSSLTRSSESNFSSSEVQMKKMIIWNTTSIIGVMLIPGSCL